jgi:hypothetical protein
MACRRGGPGSWRRTGAERRAIEPAAEDDAEREVARACAGAEVGEGWAAPAGHQHPLPHEGQRRRGCTAPPTCTALPAIVPFSRGVAWREDDDGEAQEEGGVGASSQWDGISLGFGGIGGDELLRDWGIGTKWGLVGRTTPTPAATRDQLETHPPRLTSGPGRKWDPRTARGG